MARARRVSGAFLESERAPPYWRRLLLESGGSERRAGAARRLAMYALGRLVPVRALALAIARRRRRSGVLPPADSLFDADPGVIAAALRRDGYDSSLRLPHGLAAELAAAGALAPPTPQSSFDTSCAAALERLARDPMIHAVVDDYLGRPAVYAGCRMWRLRPGQTGHPRETGVGFHYDLYDYRSLVFLIYLSDVDPESGPHVCVRGSHRSRAARHQLRPRRSFSDAEVTSAYGSRLVEICGPAGTVVAEDPFCIHRAVAPTRGARLAVQLLFTSGCFPAPSFHLPRRGESPARGRD